TTIEIINPREVRVLEGELQIDPPQETSEKQSLLLIGPKEQKIPIRHKQFYRRIKDQLVRIEKPPQWLQGYEGTAVVHSIGSLVAKVDGRDVPLSVGYHHVSVDIRDQIARTTIEQSFVNHTPTQTEGIFYFPLPQDSSISGFGMWIGNELIEADIVEKQRAREIYETILRERRDPALLEWSGGNLFKARVFPIPANSEKRIKIIYIQVLPWKGGEYRYQYALQSEMLKQKPLRDLCIDVTIHSALPIQEVRSPTHSVRSDHTRNSAHVEFSAQEYSPESDFEIVVVRQERAADAVMIPHQRGEDGYFLLQLTPPAPSGQWRREVLGDGDPIELLILADTSASLDTESRKKQEKVIAALLASLGSGDTFNLAVCDVDCEWIFEAPRPVTEQNINQARTMLDKRASLGWTDLDKAFLSAQDQCGPATHVIYIGDGIVTTGQADPVACADRIRRHYEKKPAGTFHAITVSNTYELALLRSIAALGGGSFRQVSGEATPESVATELLGEISQPTIRNLKIEFRNLRVARVYPDPLPNLAAGTQQIVLGRYLPEGKDQQGEVIVTGTRGGKPIQFSTNVSLKNAEQGNSFIPRLWARMHLDALMQQGASEAIQQEIIALSEQYHIITPYTSLLVLESDADRERFKVTRRFQMRDGEKFFAEGRDTANYQLVQQQMRRAGLWRAGLRQRVLLQFAQMGRDIRRFVPQQDEFNRRFVDHEKYPLGLRSGSTRTGLEFGGQFGLAGDWYLGYERGDGSGPTNWFLQDGLVRTSSLSTFAPSSMESATPAMAYDMKKLGEMEPPRAGPADEPGFLFDDFSTSEDALSYSMEESSRKRNAKWDLYDYEGQLPITAGSIRALQSFGTSDVNYDADFLNGPFSKYEHSSEPLSLGLMPSISHIVAASRPAGRYRGTFLSHFPDSTSWFNALFPSVPHTPESVDLIQEPKSSWPLEAVALSQSLLRKETLLALDGGLEIRQTSEYFNPRWDRTTMRSGRLEIYTPKCWLFRPWNLSEHSIVQWCRGMERGTLSEAFLLGRIRKAMPSDLAPRELQLGGFPLIQKPLHLIYSGYQATMEPLENPMVRIILQHPANPAEQIRLTIDRQFNALVSEEQYHSGKRTTRKTYSDFVQVAGLWWPQQIETFDDGDRRTTLIRQTFQHLETDQATQRIEEELLQAGYDRAILVPQPLPRLRAARRAVASGKATIPDQFALLLHDSASQRWDRVIDHLDSIKDLASGKTGLRWVEAAILRARRNNEELRKWILHEAQERAADPLPNPSETGSRSSNYYLAQYLIQQASGALNSQEMLTLLGRLRPIYARQPDYTEAMKHWISQQVNHLQQVDRPDEALQRWTSLANRFPHDANLQQQYANQLAGDGQYEAAYHHLQKTIVRENRWDVHEDDALRNTYVNLLEQEGRWPDMVAYLSDWIARKPSREWPYRYYLSVLVRTEQQEEADALIRQWLQEGRQSEPLEPDVAARMEAAIQHALGKGINVRSSQLDSKWLEPLSATADYFATHATHMHLANLIMMNQYFRKSDPAKRLREKYAGILKDQIGNLQLAQIERYVDWIWSEDPQPDSAAWKRIADGLIRRWETETDLSMRQRIAQPLARILQHKINTDAWLAFLRRQTEDQEDKSAYARLFEALLSQPWNPDYANELFSIFEKASMAQPETMRPVMTIASLHRLNDYWIKSRLDHLMAQIKDQEKIPRKELLEKRELNLKQAREELSARLAVEMAKREGHLADWMHVEQLDLEVRLGRELEKVVNACWEKLGAKPTVARAADDSDFDMDSDQEADIHERRQASTQTWLDAMLQERLLTILSAIGVREDAQPELRTRLLEYVDAGIRLSAQEGKAAEMDDRAADPSLGWKQLKHDLLIAWDKPELLEQALSDWSMEQPDAAVWKFSLGYLLAERGKIREAIRIWEPLEAEGLLGPDQYRTLAAWYQTVDRREDFRRAKIEIYKTTEEWQLLNTITSALQPWQRSDQTLPSTLDDDTLLLFAALIEKSNQPQNYLWHLRSFYTATRDFRLLACLADAVVGQTAGKIYPLLEQMHLVLAEVRDEATADSIVEHIAKLRTCAKTPIDHRALDLLNML
ncbi:MAG: hypothetical protein JW829_06430, partial [Pirellulales bacterium]|nr:hypothetical protein [Pirellulales bacterium]